MRKFFAITLISYLLAFSFPFMAIADDYESCYEMGECDGVSEEDQQEISERIREEEAAEATSTESSTEEEDDPNAQQEGESDCEYNGSNCPSLVEVTPQGLDQFCPFTTASSDTLGFTAEIDLDAEDQEAEQKKADDSFEAWSTQQAEYIATNGIKKDTCGKPSSFLSEKFLEKGDCSAAGKVITEISEVIAPDVVLDEDNQIVTVYSGLCCLYRITSTDGRFISCEETVTFYAKDYSTCSKDLASCEKRQWVIGSSGIGIVKLMVKQIFTFGVLAVGSIAVSTIVFQGIKISVSGVSGDITESKNKILQAIAGIVLLFLSGLILYAINPTFFGP